MLADQAWVCSCLLSNTSGVGETVGRLVYLDKQIATVSNYSNIFFKLLFHRYPLIYDSFFLVLSQSSIGPFFAHQHRWFEFRDILFDTPAKM